MYQARGIHMTGFCQQCQWIPVCQWIMITKTRHSVSTSRGHCLRHVLGNNFHLTRSRRLLLDKGCLDRCVWHEKGLAAGCTEIPWERCIISICTHLRTISKKVQQYFQSWFKLIPVISFATQRSYRISCQQSWFCMPSYSPTFSHRLSHTPHPSQGLMTVGLKGSTARLVQWVSTHFVPFRTSAAVSLNFDILDWLVVYLPLWKIWKSVGVMKFPIYGEKTCSKPPTSWSRYVSHVSLDFGWFWYGSILVPWFPGGS